MRLSERTFGTATLGLGVLLIAIMSTALAAFDGTGAWVVALLGGAVLGILIVLAGVGIVGISKGVRALRAAVAHRPADGSAERRPACAGSRRRARTRATDAVFSLHLLDGFKSYNEAYGEACGDTMLLWLADKLHVAANGSRRALPDARRRIRPAGARHRRGHARCPAAVADALLETGEGFVIRSRSGEVVLPGHDRNGQRDTQGRRPSGAEPTHGGTARRGVRRPRRSDRHHADPVRSLFDVAELAIDVGRRMGLPADRLDDLAAAAHLRDIGNMALPGEILRQ